MGIEPNLKSRGGGDSGPKLCIFRVLVDPRNFACSARHSRNAIFGVHYRSLLFSTTDLYA